MISLYSHRATAGTDEKDEWIRKTAMIVLLYEGIVAGVLDFDYAPSSNFVENRRIWMNVSQEGKSDVEFLREEVRKTFLFFHANNLPLVVRN